MSEIDRNDPRHDGCNYYSDHSPRPPMTLSPGEREKMMDVRMVLVPEDMVPALIAENAAFKEELRILRNALIGIEGNASTRLWSLQEVGRVAGAALRALHKEPSP